MNNKKSIFKNSATGLILFLSISAIVAWFGAQFGTGSWYFEIQRPSWTPPGWLFGPVWTMLYIMMALSAWIVWKNSEKKFFAIPLVAFYIKMIFNGTWSFVFFGIHEIGWAVVNILVLLTLIILVTYLFYKKSRTAGFLMIPYILWVSFASVLNFTIWKIN